MNVSILQYSSPFQPIDNIYMAVIKNFKINLNEMGVKTLKLNIIQIGFSKTTSKDQYLPKPFDFIEVRFWSKKCPKWQLGSPRDAEPSPAPTWGWRTAWAHGWAHFPN